MKMDAQHIRGALPPSEWLTDCCAGVRRHLPSWDGFLKLLQPYEGWGLDLRTPLELAYWHVVATAAPAKTAAHRAIPGVTRVRMP